MSEAASVVVLQPTPFGRVTVVVLATALRGLCADYAGCAVGHSANGYGTILHTTNSGAKAALPFRSKTYSNQKKL